MTKSIFTQEKLNFIDKLKGNQLKYVLGVRQEQKLNENISHWERNGRKGPRPSQLNPLEVAKLLNEYIAFALINNDENQRLAFYDAATGIYTQNQLDIKAIVAHVEPLYNERKAEEVIYHLKILIKNTEGIRKKTRDKHLIAVNNGIYNSETHELMKFSPEYVFTTKIETDYIKDAVHPDLNGWHFDTWLSEIACGDKQVTQLLWEVINEVLNGNYTRKKAFFLIGKGNNGKGTFQELLMQLVGTDNVGMLKAHEFDKRFALEAIRDRSLVIGDDVPPSVFTDDLANFKSIITGDPVSIEGKNKPAYHDVLTPTIIQSTNGMLRSLDKSHGLLRRLMIVPFLANFESGKTENTNIKEVYLRDKQLLEYVLKQAIEMNFDTFTVPDVSVEALETFKRDNDPVYEFKCTVIDTWETDALPKNVVYDVYKVFCDDYGYHVTSNRKFHKELAEHLQHEWVSKSVRVANTVAQLSCQYEPYKEINQFADTVLSNLGDKPRPQSCYERIAKEYDTK